MEKHSCHQGLRRRPFHVSRGKSREFPMAPGTVHGSCALLYRFWRSGKRFNRKSPRIGNQKADPASSGRGSGPMGYRLRTNLVGDARRKTERGIYGSSRETPFSYEKCLSPAKKFESLKHFFLWGVTNNEINRKKTRFGKEREKLFCRQCYGNIASLAAVKCPFFTGSAVWESAHTVFATICILFDIDRPADSAAVDRCRVCHR